MNESTHNLSVSKATAAAFVHAAKEMEISVYTLRELASELRERAKEVPIEAAKQEVRNCESRVREKQDRIVSLQKEIKRQESSTCPSKERFPFFQKFTEYFRKWFSAIRRSVPAIFKFGYEACGPVAFFVFTMWVLCYVALAIAVLYPVLALVTVWFYLPIAAIQHSKKEKNRILSFPKEKREHLKKLKKDLADLQEFELDCSKYNLEDAQKELQHRQAIQTCLREQAADAESKARQINSYLQECYRATGIVGPDYRRIDCMLVFDHVFRNDLGDTVRDAVFYYEQQQFRNTVKLGMSSIFEMLGDMASKQRYVELALNDIRSEVTRLGGAFSSQAERQQRLENDHEKLLRESKASQEAVDRYYKKQQENHEYLKKLFS